MPDPDAQQKSRDAIRAHLGAALRRAVEEMGRAEYAALEVQYLMTDRCLALEFNRQLTEALLTSAADDRTAKLAGLSSVFLRAPDVARDLRADAEGVHADLTEALYPFGPAGEVPTEPGHYDMLSVAGVWGVTARWSAVVYLDPHEPRLNLISHDGVLSNQGLCPGDNFESCRFAVRPTRKPPTP